MHIDSITTRRLELVAATPDTVRAALAGPAALQARLDARVPPAWPHEYLDAAAFGFFLDKLVSGEDQAGWWLRFVLLRGDDAARVLIGSAGYKGPPSPGGALEIGYGIVASHRRKGYATEVVQGLAAHAFRLPEVTRVVAETLPELAGSIGVLQRSGFHRVDAAQPRPLRYELARTDLLRTGKTSAPILPARNLGL